MKLEKKYKEDPYIIHLNIALFMVASLHFGGKSHVSNGCKMYLVRNPGKHGYGSKLNHQGTAGFSCWFHLPGLHFGVTLFLTHSRIQKMKKEREQKSWIFKNDHIYMIHLSADSTSSSKMNQDKERKTGILALLPCKWWFPFILVEKAMCQMVAKCIL